ncbi:MAG: flavin reductase, partial [Tannerellaceae bacterium]
ASWGGLGMMFGKPVAFCFINPTRHTFDLMEKSDTYTFTFYTEAYRDALKYCGSTSGKNTDKVKGSGLTPITTPTGSKAFGEAWMIVECRKLLSQPIDNASITNQALTKEMSGKQLNQMFVGEIINVWIK